MTKVIQLPHNDDPSAIQAILKGVWADKEAVCFVWPSEDGVTCGQSYSVGSKDFYLRKTYRCNAQGEIGETKHFYSNGKIKSIYPYENGKLNGTVVEYGSDGALVQECNYKQGQLDGQSVDYYQNGQVKKATFYKAGKQHGRETEYQVDGSVYQEEEYENGLKHGACTRYYTNGSLSYRAEYKEGKEHGMYRSYRKDGSLARECTYQDNWRSGLEVVYKPDGSIEAIDLHGEKYNALKAELRRREFRDDWRHFIGKDKRNAHERIEGRLTHAKEVVVQMNTAPQII